MMPAMMTTTAAPTRASNRDRRGMRAVGAPGDRKLTPPPRSYWLSLHWSPGGTGGGPGRAAVRPRLRRGTRCWSNVRTWRPLYSGNLSRPRRVPASPRRNLAETASTPRPRGWLSPLGRPFTSTILRTARERVPIRPPDNRSEGRRQTGVLQHSRSRAEPGTPRVRAGVGPAHPDVRAGADRRPGGTGAPSRRDAGPPREGGPRRPDPGGAGAAARRR